MQRLHVHVPFVVLLLGAASCRSSVEPPDPQSFGPLEERQQADPRSIAFDNQSVEMAALEIFAPRHPPKDCRSEAPHRLLCPADYVHILAKSVYPRTQVVARYPKELPFDCAQIWVRVRTRAMPPDEFREAIFLLSNDKGLVLQLSEGEAARLEEEGITTRNKFPAPVRFCDPAQPSVQEAEAKGTRDPEEVDRALEKAGPAVARCCAAAKACRGNLRATLTLTRDGAVRNIQVEAGQGELPRDCLFKALSGLSFAGFTPTQTTAEVTLKLPLPLPARAP